MEQSNDWVQMVIEVTKDAQEKGSDPHVWAMQLSKFLNSERVSLPSIEVAEALVSYICWDNNVPILWKFLDKALVLNIVPPLLVLALFSTRFFFIYLLLLLDSCFFLGYYFHRTPIRTCYVKKYMLRKMLCPKFVIFCLGYVFGVLRNDVAGLERNIFLASINRTKNNYFI